jgi:hypothetical protein
MLRRRQSDRQSQKQTFAIRGANRERSARFAPDRSAAPIPKSALTTSGGDELHDKPALSAAAVLSMPVGFAEGALRGNLNDWQREILSWSENMQPDANTFDPKKSANQY